MFKHTNLFLRNGSISPTISRRRFRSASHVPDDAIPKKSKCFFLDSKRLCSEYEVDEQSEYYAQQQPD